MRKVLLYSNPERTEKVSRKGAKKTYRLFATREIPLFIREAPKLMRSPSPIIHSFLPLRLCAFA